MAASVIGALRVNLGLDSAQFERGTKRAKTASQQLASDFRMLGAAGAAVGAALAAMAKRGGDEIDRLAKAGRRIDTSVTGMRALELAAGEAGVSVGGLTDAVQNLNREVAAGSTGATAALQRLGLAASDLQNLEADEKLALIADRVKEMGLSTGEATQILREFGIRNRDMVLLLMQGGDALRNARNDIEDYGLAVSAVDASAIEAANDQIGRLGLVAQFAGQELARNLVPAMGRFAEAMTDSLREGGALRAVIEAVTGQAQRLMSVALAAVGAFAAYRTVLLGVAAAKWLVVGATNGLRVALLRLGLPALIIGMGEVIYQFGRLSEATGGWGAALEALGDLAEGVWEGIKTSAKAIVPALGAVWMDIRAGFFGMLEALSNRWARFLTGISQSAFSLGWDDVAQRIGGAAESAWESFDGFSEAARNAAGAADQLRSQASQMATAGFDQAREALDRLNEIMNQNVEDTSGAAEAARNLAAELEAVGGEGGGGGAAAAAADGIRGIGQTAVQTAGMMDRLRDGMANAFAGIITGAQSAKDAISQLLQSLANMLANQAFQMLFGSLFGGIGAPLNAMGAGPLASFEGGGFTGHGARTGGLDGRGGQLALLHPNETVIDHTRGGRAGGGDPVQVVVRIMPSGEFESFVEEKSGRVAVSVMQGYDRALPQRMRQIQNDPRGMA